MRAIILNSDWEHPADGWYQIEAKGQHPNARAGVVQVIDDTACASIVNRFNAEASKPGFPGMIIDQDHFKHNPDKATTAFGWLMRLQNRADGIYGQIRWTATGQKAVDGGDLRFFSTEYAQKDCEVLSSGNPRRIRPMHLAGLTLTNVNNNKGQKPITNRTNNDFMNTTSTLQTDYEPDLAAQRSMAIDRIRVVNRRLTYCEARRQLRKSSPHLFADQLGAITAATVQNRAVEAPRQDLIAISNGINAIRASNPKISYGEARIRLRRVNPGIFGIDS